MKIPVSLFLATTVLKSVSCFTPSASLTAQSSTQLAASALIVQNKGGGHGELGYQLAKTLLGDSSDVDSITILQDSACNFGKEPFKSYESDLPNVKVVTADLSNDQVTSDTLEFILGGPGTGFDYVFDNNSKKPAGAAKACADMAKGMGVKLYTYVSSAGVYKPPKEGPFPMPETTATKDAGQVQFEDYCTQIGLPLASFRPQYIYGPKANKHDYVDYFFDRLIRGLPVPIPGDGSQLVSLTNSEDVARLLASGLSNIPAATAGRIYNCGTDQLISYNDLTALCARVAGVSNFQIEYFDADLLGKGNFPFRPTNFYVAPDKAKAELSYVGAQCSLEDDLVWYFDQYKERGGPTKQMSLQKDWEIVVGHKTPIPGQMGSIYDQYDPLVIQE